MVRLIITTVAILALAASAHSQQQPGAEQNSNAPQAPQVPQNGAPAMGQNEPTGMGNLFSNFLGGNNMMGGQPQQPPMGGPQQQQPVGPSPPPPMNGQQQMNGQQPMMNGQQPMMPFQQMSNNGSQRQQTMGGLADLLTSIPQRSMEMIQQVMDSLRNMIPGGRNMQVDQVRNPMESLNVQSGSPEQPQLGAGNNNNPIHRFIDPLDRMNKGLQRAIDNQGNRMYETFSRLGERMPGAANGNNPMQAVIDPLQRMNKGLQRAIDNTGNRMYETFSRLGQRLPGARSGSQTGAQTGPQTGPSTGSPISEPIDSV